MHLKRIAMPKSWSLPRKGKRFIIRGKGPYTSKISFPLLVILRDLLKEVKTRKEAKKVLQEGLVFINNRIVKDEKFNVGLFDRIYIKKLEKTFSLYLTKKGKLIIQEINKERALKKPCKVIGKKNIKGNKIQINLYDGKNLITDKKDFKVGDTLILDLKKNNIIDCLKLAKGAFVFIIGGKHIGNIGKISEIDNKISVVIEDKTFKISKENIFVIEKGEFK